MNTVPHILNFNYIFIILDEKPAPVVRNKYNVQLEPITNRNFHIEIKETQSSVEPRDSVKRAKSKKNSLFSKIFFFQFKNIK